jgi:phosphatidylglycerophosphate synthase
VLAAVADIYRSSRKRKDINWFTRNVARPPAAVLVYLLRGTPITPNQVTFLATAVCVGAAAIIALTPGSWTWLVVGALVFELSFVLDCVDGMLARLRKHASPVGHLLDFLMDELKATLVYGAVAIRLWQETGDERLLLVGLAGMYCIASGISLTTFMRRPEYGAAPATAEGQPAQLGRRRGLLGAALSGVEWAARWLVHYPQYIWICAVANRLDLYFWTYGAVNALYLARSLLAIGLRLGRFGAPATRFEDGP